MEVVCFIFAECVFTWDGRFVLWAKKTLIHFDSKLCDGPGVMGESFEESRVQFCSTFLLFKIRHSECVPLLPHLI